MEGSKASAKERTSSRSKRRLVVSRADPDKYTLRVNMKIPKITNEGEYEMGGKMLVMPVSGNGHYVLTMSK